MNRSSSQVRLRLANLALDELELASLRGHLAEASLDVNFDARMGRGALHVERPRYSGLQVRECVCVCLGGGQELIAGLTCVLKHGVLVAIWRTHGAQVPHHSATITPPLPPPLTQPPPPPRLQGTSLQSSLRWERDIIRLERAVLAQRRSRYEVQGEYVLPPNAPRPASAAEMMAAGEGEEPPEGRWRVQVGAGGGCR